MPHPKQHISDLPEICRRKGIRHIVISPGSRSAPLIQSFYQVFGESCISLVDERSSAYFALGIAACTQTPVVLICTSGTALLNYAPALAEAFYQGVPLIAVTADRPHEWIDQQDNQTLRQSGIYRNYIKAGFDMPQVINTGDELWHVHRMVNEAVNLSLSAFRGPVHINVPLTEPLYGELPPHSEKIRIMDHIQPENEIQLPDELVGDWQKAGKIMILHGQDIPGNRSAAFLAKLAADPRVIVIAENIANIPGPYVIRNSNLVLSKTRNESPAYPDLLLHSGGQIVSKALTGYLRRAPELKAWRLEHDSTLIDTFKLTSRHFSVPAHLVYKGLSSLPETGTETGYRQTWLDAAEKAIAKSKDFMNHIPFSDLKVFDQLFPLIRTEMNVVSGNSSIIRYLQLSGEHDGARYFGNRGVSGIDGCLSSAAGIAFASGELTLAITGDLGFVYDSNALWNNNLPKNLRIVVINNGGGGIFHILKGASEHPGFKKFIEANHQVDLKKLVSAYGADFYLARREEDISGQWNDFIAGNNTAVMEIRTDAAISAGIFRELMQSLS